MQDYKTQVDSGEISNSPLYSETKKKWTKKIVKIINLADAFKGYVSFFNVEILIPSYDSKILNLQLQIISSHW